MLAARLGRSGLALAACRRAVPAASLAVRGLKTGTGIVGLEVEPEAKSILSSLYSTTLVKLAKIPEASEYRKAVEKMTSERLAVIQGTDDLDAIEAAIGGGQVEQLIQQAKDELGLIPDLIAVRAFDPYEGSPADEIYLDLKRRGVALQRDDIPMRQSQDFPTERFVELELPQIEEEEKK